MKTVVIALGIVIAMGVVLQVMNDLNTTEVQWGTTATTTELVKEVLPVWAEDEDAVKAAQDVIRRKELEAELATLTSEVAERETRITEIEKELGTY